MHEMRRMLFGIVFLVLVAVPLQGVFAQGDKAYIGYRQKVMKTMGANIGAIGDILKNKLPQKGNIADHARIINMNSKLIPSAFKKQISAGPTDAKGKIWQDWSQFEEAAKKVGKESARLADIAASGSDGEIMAQVKELGGACKGCHKEYRKPKKESYKRK